MILGSVRISKKTNLQGGLIHNCYSNKSVTNECMNNLYEVNNRGQIKNGKFLRDGKHSSMFDRLKKDFTDYQSKVKEDYNKNNKQKLRKDANMFFEGVITFGSSKGEDFDKRIRELSNNEMFIGSVIKSVRDMLKENGIEGDFKLFQHNDEKSLHFHFDFVPYNWNTHKMVNQEFSPSYMSKIQDILYNNLKEYGIHRGIKKQDRIQKYCEDNNIKKEDLTIEDYQEINIKNKSLKNHNNNLEKTNRELKKKIERYENDIFPKMVKKFNTANIKLQQLKKQIQEEERKLRKQGLTKEKLKEGLIILGNQKRDIKKQIKDLKTFKNNLTNNKLNEDNLRQVLKECSSWAGTIDFDKFSKYMNVVHNEKNKEIIKQLEEEKETSKTKTEIIKTKDNTINRQIKEMSGKEDTILGLRENRKKLNEDIEYLENKNQKQYKYSEWLEKQLGGSGWPQKYQKYLEEKQKQQEELKQQQKQQGIKQN